MNFLSDKSRKPKFELHLKIFDLNNVPLVSGTSFIRWRIAGSIHAEHRGRTDRCSIANHRVDYNYSKAVSSIRIPIDKNGSLGEALLEFDVLQEFSSHDDKTRLGLVKLNLSEYVEESDGLVTRKRGGAMNPMPSPTALSTGSASVGASTGPDGDVEEGVVRRYLMQDSRINSTLKISILMLQIDGERNYVAPPLKTAPVFGGIAGIMLVEQVEPDDTAGQLPSISKPRDAAEVQDMYRRALAASWSAQPGEFPADHVIENMFGGGDGWSLASTKKAARDEEGVGNVSADEGMGGGTLRPSDLRRMQKHRLFGGHRRHKSSTSEKTTHTVTLPERTTSSHGRPRSSVKDDETHGRGRSESLASLAPTLSSSDRDRDLGVKRAREVGEDEVRDDLVAWRLPGCRA